MARRSRLGMPPSPHDASFVACASAWPLFQLNEKDSVARALKAPAWSRWTLQPWRYALGSIVGSQIILLAVYGSFGWTN